jgi:hypothetical protein
MLFYEVIIIVYLFMQLMFKTTMTGSFYRTKEIVELLGKSKTGEVSEKNSKEIEAAEKLAISDQLHPEDQSTV